MQAVLFLAKGEMGERLPFSTGWIIVAGSSKYVE
jgi:hypothetical protein